MGAVVVIAFMILVGFIFYTWINRPKKRALDEINRLEKKLALYKRALDRIASIAGHPDASEGCRLVIRLVNQTLDQAKEI